MSEEATGYKKPPFNRRFGGENANKRNSKGRPKSFDELRKLALEIAHRPVGPQGQAVVEAILLRWASSNNAVLQLKFLEIAYGRVPDTLPNDTSDLAADWWRAAESNEDAEEEEDEEEDE